MIVYNFDVTNTDELSKIIWQMLNDIKDLKDKVEKLKSNPSDIEQIKADVCDYFCRMVERAADQEELDEICKLCPLNRLEVTIDE